MSIAIAVSGADTLTLNNLVLTDFADANCAELTFPNDIANIKTGKNGNSIYGLNTSGRQAELKIRLLRAGNDDKALNALLANQQNNFAGTALLIGSLVKKVGDGTGKNIANDTYVLQGGIFVKIPEAMTNVEGDATQSVVIYTIRFSNAQRVIQ